MTVTRHAARPQARRPRRRSVAHANAAGEPRTPEPSIFLKAGVGHAGMLVTPACNMLTAHIIAPPPTPTPTPQGARRRSTADARASGELQTHLQSLAPNSRPKSSKPSPNSSDALPMSANAQPKCGRWLAPSLLPGWPPQPQPEPASIAPSNLLFLRCPPHTRYHS